MITGYIAYFSKCHAIAYVMNTQLISLRPMKLYPIVLFPGGYFFLPQIHLGLPYVFSINLIVIVIMKKTSIRTL